MSREFKIDYIPHLNEYILYTASSDNNVGIVKEVEKLPRALKLYVANTDDVSNIYDYSSNPDMWSYTLEKDKKWIEEYLKEINPNRPNYCRFKNKELAEQVSNYFNSIIVMLKLIG